jgi:hypothetical protein
MPGHSSQKDFLLQGNRKDVGEEIEQKHETDRNCQHCPNTFPLGTTKASLVMNKPYILSNWATRPIQLLVDYFKLE